MTRKRSVPLVVAVAIGVTAACHDKQLPTGATALAGPHYELAAFAPTLLNAGCAVGQETGLNTARFAVLNRSDLPVALPHFSAATGVGRSKNALRVTRFRVKRESGTIVHFACLAPYDRTYERLINAAFERAEREGRWESTERILASSPSERMTKTVDIDVGVKLRTALFPNAKRLSPATLASVVPWASDTGRPAVPMPPITVTSDAPTWVIDSWEFTLTARQGRSFSELIGWDFYGGPDCAGASDFWFATQEEIDAMEEEAELIRMGKELLVPKQCELVPAANICIDFYIRHRRSFIFGGNDREENPWAGIKDSKVHLYLSTDSVDYWEVKINSTRIRIGNAEILPVEDSARLFKPDSDVVVDHLSNGEIHVKFTFMNNYCPSRSVCAAIDGKIEFKPDPSKVGGYDIYWERDAYPTMAIYKKIGSEWVNMALDPEHSDGGWTAWWALIDGYKQSRRLPPPCALQ